MINKQAVLVGTWCEIPSPYLTNVLGKSGLDFVILDMEHSVFGFETIQNSVFAAHSENMQVFIRVSALRESEVKRALDTGADGLFFHQIKNMDDISAIAKYSKFEPLGKRGFNPFTPAYGYAGVDSDFLQQQNDLIKTAIIIENKEILLCLDDILKNPIIDIIYIGQYDLSVEYGIPGQTSHQIILDCMEVVKEKAKKFNKKVGAMVHTKEEAKQLIAKGFNFIVYKTDTGVIQSTYSDFMKEVK